MSDFSTFRRIRELYAIVLPRWMEDYRDTGNMRHDPYFMDWKFTPIERSVWCDLRCAGLPFYPQMPVLNYFIDFGNPFLRIGIECDGKEWHDKERDKIRDERLSRAGWVIYRIPGHECARTVDLSFEAPDHPNDPQIDTNVRHYMDTSEGLIRAIGVQHFGMDPVPGHDLARGATLTKHQTASGCL